MGEYAWELRYMVLYGLLKRAQQPEAPEGQLPQLTTLASWG